MDLESGDRVWHCLRVNASAPVLDALHAPEPRAASIVETLLKSWIAYCEEYRGRERRDLIERKPTSAKVEEFREDLKWLLRSAGQLHSLLTDPDYPAPQYAEEFGWRVRQLEDSWKSLNNAMSQGEADALLTKHFADDPLTPKLVVG